MLQSGQSRPGDDRAGEARAGRIYDIVARAARRRPEAAAIASVEGDVLTFAALLTQIEETVGSLNAMGIGRDDRVAAVLPEGPPAAVAFLAVASAAAYMPLDPAYRSAELEYRLSHGRIGAVILPEGTDPPARTAATELGIPVLELAARPQSGAGAFRLDGSAGGPPTRPGLSEPDDVALLAFTSGTTSRPKPVALTHARLCAGACNLAAWLRLGPEDRGLNVMPLCHIHAQVRGLLSPLAAGACVTCAPAQDMAAFMGWVRASGTTYYSASPPVHRQVLSRALEDPASARSCPIRIVGSSSAPLDPDLKEELGRALEAVVIDSYGLTETSTQVVGTPLPPAECRRGAVGVVAGAEVAIADEEGRHLGPGRRGEVVVRGPGVITAYDDETVNGGAFFGDWLRTGDEGYFDEDGFFFLLGRTRDVINRGGEKISPREVEQAVLGHPAVREAAAFGLPDSRLGESVATAVVLEPGAEATEHELIRFAAARIADFKVPSRVFACDELPHTRSGKVQRSKLRERFAALLAEEGRKAPVGGPAGPGNPIEAALVGFWREVLGPEAQLDRRSSFFEVGGDSLAAAGLLARVENAFCTEFPAALFYREPTIRGMASCLAEEAGEWGLERMVALEKSGRARPLFFCTAGPAWFLVGLARRLGAERPFYALQAYGLEDRKRGELDIREVACAYVAQIRAAQPEGPYQLAGMSAGGVVALEIAHQLAEQGQEVSLLAVIDGLLHPTIVAPFGDFPRMLQRQRERLRRFPHMDTAARIAALRSLPDRIRQALGGRGSRNGNADALKRHRRRIHDAVVPMIDAHRRGVAKYRFRPFPGRIIYYWCEDSWFLTLRDPRLGWDELAEGGFVMHRVPGYHYEVLEEPSVQVLAAKLRPYLAEA